MKNKALLALLASGALTASVTAQTVDSVLTSGVQEPHSVAVDTNNVFYITDSANNRVVRYASDSGLLTSLAGLAGQPEGTNNGTGVFARFFDPKGIVYVPSRGGLVVADYGNHTLRLVTFSGVVTTLAGSPGKPGKDDGPAAAATFNYPIGLAVDGAGNIFIADSKNSAIRKLDVNGNVSTLANITGLYEPAAVVVGDNGDIWVADTRNHTIKGFNSSGVLYPNRIVGSNSRYVSGNTDAINGTNALFNNPRGLLWLGGNTGLLVSDSGNHTLRQIYYNTNFNDFSVTTFAGIPGQPGLVDAALLSAKFNSPIGLARDLANGGFIIVDSANNAVRRIQTAPPLPPISNPQIGYVIFVEDQSGTVFSRLVPVTQAVFNNEVIIAILGEQGTENFFTFGPSPVSILEDAIPLPDKSTGRNAPPYRNGLFPSQVAPSMIDPQPDVTIKAISTQDGRRPSGVVQARFQFKTATPIVLGNNAASFSLTNATQEAEMFYTTDGSDPTNNLVANPAGVRFITGETLSFILTDTNLVFKVRAFKQGFAPSAVLTNIFSPTNFVANRVSFGFEAGEASSSFVGSAGQRFYAPVTLTLLPEQKMYSLQFNLTVTNVAGSPPINITPLNDAIGFDSMLVKPIPGTKSFVAIPPQMFVGSNLVYLTNSFVTNINGVSVFTNAVTTNVVLLFTNLLFTNYTQNLLGVGWLERAGAERTNLFDTAAQDLITYSLPHDSLFESKNGKVVLGAFSFVVPTTAALNQKYRIQIGRPSATDDGIGRPGHQVFIQTPTNVNESLIAIKDITIGSRRYVVGDVAPFRWFNAGDFGDTNLLSDDLVQVFQSAVYRYDIPPFGSDFYDALDSSNGTTNSVFDGNDKLINNIQFGDGVLRVDDVFVTFRRSLDPTLTWYARFWSNGLLRAVAVPNLFRGAQGNSLAPRFSSNLATASSDEPASVAPISPAVNFSAGDVVGNAGQTISVPIQAQVSGVYPVRVLMLNLNVVPLDGAPILTKSVQFTPAAGLGQPTLTTSRGAANYAAAWLNNSVAGVSGNNSVGTLQFTVPENATANAAYKIEFEHISASPNGLALFPQQTVDGLVTLADRTNSSWNDGIPDTWRLRYFGSVNNLLSHASADADGDGVPNGVEFRAGTNPTDIRSRLELLASRLAANNPDEKGLVLRWPTVANKRYVLECSPALSGAAWTVISGNILGTGQETQFTETDLTRNAQFYRVRLAE